MDLQTIVIVTLALGAGGLVKGALGVGLPLVALPVLTTAFGLQQAIGIMLMPIILTNAMQARRYRDSLRDPAMGFLPGFLLGGIVGIGLGTVALVTLPERLLEAGLGLMLLAYVALRMARPDFGISPPLARKVAVPVGVAGGAVMGATGLVVSVGLTYINAMRMARQLTVFAASLMFLVYGVAQVGALTVAGVYRLEWLWLGLFAVLPVIAAMPLGEALGRGMGAVLFDRILLFLLAVIGAKMMLGL